MPELPAQDATPILVVDDDAAVRDVISVLLGEDGYAVTAVSSADAALDALRSTRFPLVISDVRMPGHDGFWLLDRIREASADTAVIMLTAYGDTEAAVECLRNGAADYLLKPPKVTDLIRAIERALGRRSLALARVRYQEGLEQRVREKTSELSRALRDLESTYSQTLWTLVAALDAREHETSDHSQRVVRYTLAVARRLGVPEREWADVGRGALLHDIGKIGVPDAILLKPGALTPDEWVEMRKHPRTGSNILRTVDFLAGPAEMVLCHQERFDGGGYPRNLAGEAIPLPARIFAVADTYDAMTSDRPYRRALGVDAARAEIARCAGTQFDPRCADAFLSIGEDELARLARPAPPGAMAALFPAR
ncbi:HD domain-containing phosphohydrolase [Anaeromyxobacter oryzae]|uniref:Two-component system response regulator n=1 Tax=Anaeromyxobacter oryzae TaxID=2918170 RepID=A0ABM7X4F0_9BACT|nr:HD domain-containing phosphohydrolase [Anaeromyxobacter oryzae]BDG06683.1 two-component system response regulator [Anaeromyxobacter oryzae]